MTRPNPDSIDIEKEVLGLWEGMFGDATAAHANSHIIGYMDFIIRVTALINKEVEHKSLDAAEAEIDRIAETAQTLEMKSTIPPASYLPTLYEFMHYRKKLLKKLKEGL